MKNQEYYYYLTGRPRSTDTIEHDLFVHHEAFKSVQSTLITQYNLDGTGYTGVLVKEWNVSTDEQVWTFHVREGLTFESGNPINADAIVLSLTRILYLQKQRGSHSKLLDFLVDVDSIKSPASQFEGIKKVSNDKFQITLSRPFPKLLDQLSFGLYAIVDAVDFDVQSGQWIDPKKTSASGFYKIERWDDDKLVLVLREEAALSKLAVNPVKRWVLSWKSKVLPRIDLAEYKSTEEVNHPDLIKKTGAFNKIYYAHCVSWAHPESPCRDVEYRRWLRDQFHIHSKGKHKSVAFSKSFFPEHMKGVGSDGLELNSKTPAQYPKLRVPQKFNLTSNKLHRELAKIFESIKDPSGNLIFEDAVYAAPQDDLHYTPVDSTNKFYSIDLPIYYTGILIEDPRSDIEFMFKSKEGIRLPDTDGRILKELEKEDFSVQKINELLWDQAVIWPIGHFSLDMWHSPELDLDNYNYQKPAMELQWIRQK